MFFHGFLLNGGSAYPPLTATTAEVIWLGLLLLVTGHVPHGRHLSTTCGRYCSSEPTPRLAFWSHHSPASCVTWATSQRSFQSATHRTCSLRARPACCTAHLRELPTQDPRSPVDLQVFFLRFGGEAYARCVADEHGGIYLSRDKRLGLRLLREHIGLHTPLLTEPDRRFRDSLGLRSPRPRNSRRTSFLVVFLVGEQVVLS